MKTIGDRIKYTRIIRRMTATDLADALDITVSGVSNWERNKFNPRPDMLTRVADALKVDRQFLETGEGEAPADLFTEAGPDGLTFEEAMTKAKALFAEALKFPGSRITVHVGITG